MVFAGMPLLYQERWRTTRKLDPFIPKVCRELGIVGRVP